MTSLDGVNGRSIQTLLRRENDSKQSDEFQASPSAGSVIWGVLSDFVSETQEELQKRAKSENFHHNGWVLAHKYQSDHQFVEFNPHLDNRMLF